jgi:hypothetical protein
MIKLAKFLLRCLLRLFYGVKVTGMEHYHETGERALIVNIRNKHTHCKQWEIQAVPEVCRFIHYGPRQSPVDQINDQIYPAK